MSDIVERLRQRAKPLEKRLSEKNIAMRDIDLRVSYDDLITEAADEIERLREAIVEALRLHQNWPEGAVAVLWDALEDKP